MTTYSTYVLVDLLDAFASSDPVPGGGSAAALTAAVGASLLLMVASLPKTRTGAPEEVSDLAATAARLRPIRETLISLIDRDTASYASVLDALRLPKSTDGEKAVRRNALSEAMHAATEAPLETMRACRLALGEAVVVTHRGHVAAASDAYVGIELLLAALRGAARNVDENVSSLQDGEYAARVRAERRRLEDEATRDATAARSRLRA